MAHFKRAGRLLWLILLVIFVAMIDLDLLTTQLRRVHLFPLICALLLGAPLMLLKGLRWRLILAASGVPIALRTATRLQCVGAFAGALTPAQSGDLIKLYYLRRDGHPLGPGLVSVAADRALDVLGMLLITLAGVVATGRDMFPPLPMFAAVAALLAAGVLPLMHAGLRARVRSALRLTGQGSPDLTGTAPITSWRIAGGVVLASAGALALAVVRTWLAITAAGLLLPIGALLLLTGASTLASLLSILGLGSRDAAILATLSGLALQGTAMWLDRTPMLPEALAPVALTISTLLLVLHLSTVAAGGVMASGLPSVRPDHLSEAWPAQTRITR